MEHNERLVAPQLAGYRIEGLLGRGGMGEVYRAHDTGLNRPVALKVLLAEFAEDERFRDRLLRESRLAVDQPLDRDRLVRLREEDREDRPLPLPSERDLRAVHERLEWTQDPEFDPHPLNLPCPGRRS